MRFQYDLVGQGWAECTVECGGRQATVLASYLTDALDDLCAAVAALLRAFAGAVLFPVRRIAQLRALLDQVRE